MSDDFDPRDALGMIDAEGDRVRQALDIRLPAQLAAWGLAWAIGFTVMFSDVRAQHPYVGPGPGSGIPFAVLLVAAVVVTGVLTSRGTTGIGGRAQRAGTRLGLAWGLGWLTYLVMAAQVFRAGVSPEASGILFASGAMFLTGLIYLLSGAVWDEPIQTRLGMWLMLIAAIGAVTGPVWLLLIGAVAGGGGFLVAAALARRRRG